jgi:hypothetical protein
MQSTSFLEIAQLQQQLEFQRAAIENLKRSMIEALSKMA